MKLLWYKPAFLLIAGLLVAPCGTRLEGEGEPPETVIEKTDSKDSTGVEVGAEITVLGRLINTLCYSADDPTEYDTSPECARGNTEKGYPVAVLEADRSPKEAWILVTVPQIFVDYMGQTVRVTGEIRSSGVLVPTRVELQTEDGWMFIM